MKQDIEWKGIYKSEILMVCHMDAVAMHKVGAISDKEMQEFDEGCLVRTPKVTHKSEQPTKKESAFSAIA